MSDLKIYRGDGTIKQSYTISDAGEKVLGLNVTGEPGRGAAMVTDKQVLEMLGEILQALQALKED